MTCLRFGLLVSGERAGALLCDQPGNVALPRSGPSEQRQDDRSDRGSELQGA